MGVIIATKEQIDEYFASTALSQSSLKALAQGLDSFLANQTETTELFYEEKGHFVIGSGVDCLLTGQEGQFDNEYHVSTMEKKPSDTIMSIVNQTFALVLEQFEMERADYPEMTFESFILDTGNELQVYHEHVLRACDDHEYQMRWKTETRVNKILEEGNIYFIDLQEGHGKQILDAEQHNKIRDIVMSLTTNPLTAKYFDREMQSRQENMDFYYQLPIYFTYRGIECKALLDFVAVTKDKDGKIIKIEPFDLKTMSGNTIGFSRSVSSRRYDIQGAWYTMALWNKFIGEVNDGDDVISPFTFIVESTTQIGNPLVYRCHPSLLEMGRNGRPPLKLGDPQIIEKTPYLVRNEIKGYEQLLEEYLWYEENGWEKERKVVENQGVLELDWNGII
jgi:hypothetical protein